MGPTKPTLGPWYPHKDRAMPTQHCHCHGHHEEASALVRALPTPTHRGINSPAVHCSVMLHNSFLSTIPVLQALQGGRHCLFKNSDCGLGCASPLLHCSTSSNPIHCCFFSSCPPSPLHCTALSPMLRYLKS